MDRESGMDSALPRRVIAGRHHPLVKQVRRMARAADISSDGLVLIETVRLAEEALRSGAAIHKLLICSSTGGRNSTPRVRSLLKKLRAGTEVCEVASEVFQGLASTETPQGILALARVPSWREQDLFPSGPPLLSPLVLVVAGLQDPGNLGTVLRSAEAFGVTGVILTRSTVSPCNAKVVRATAGALFRIPMLRGLTAAEAVTLLRRRRVRLFSSVVGGNKRLPDIDFSGPIAVAIGSEGAGLPPEISAAGRRLTIPMAPVVESLNAAAAAAVILYEIARQRNSRDGGS